MSSETKSWCILSVYFLGFLDLFAVSLILPLLLTHGEQLGASPVLNGLVGSVYGGLQIISSPLCGSLSDQYGRAPVLRVSMLACCASYLFLAFSDTILLLVVSRVLSGTFKHTQTLCRTLLVDLGSVSERQKVIGWFNAVSSMGFIVGPPIGGHMAGAEHGFRRVTLLCAAIFAVMFVVSVLLVRDGRRRDQSSSDHASSGATQTLTSFRDINWWDTADLMLMRLCLCFATLLFRSNFSLTVTRLYDVTPVQLGYLMSFQGLVSAAAGLLTGPWERLCRDRHTELLVTSVVFCGSLAAASAAPDLAWFTAALVPLCMCTSSLRACTAAMHLDRTPPEHHGLVMGAAQNIAAVARLGSPLAAGAAQQAAGERAPALAGTACAAVAMGVAALLRRGARPPKTTKAE